MKLIVAARYYLRDILCGTLSVWNLNVNVQHSAVILTPIVNLNLRPVGVGNAFGDVFARRLLPFVLLFMEEPGKPRQGVVGTAIQGRMVSSRARYRLNWVDDLKSIDPLRLLPRRPG